MQAAGAPLLRLFFLGTTENDMPTAKHAVIAAALVTGWSAGPLMGQTTNGIAGERAAAVIRSIENESVPPRGIAVDPTELAHARSAGEMQVAERGEPMQVERIQIDEPVRTRPGVSAPRGSRGASDKRAAARPQVVRVEGGASERVKTAATARLDDADRYREQARYDAASRSRGATATAATSEQSAPAIRRERGKAERFELQCESTAVLVVSH